MRVEAIEIEAFGRLKACRWDSLHPQAVVVYGPNEAGKSTLFRFLSAMLYGLHPADRQRHPFVPWDTSTLSGAVLLRLASGERVQVRRRLLSQPQGFMEFVDEPHRPPVELRNRAVPAVEHIPRRVFEQVFALTLDELRFPAEDAWSAIQERLLGNLANADLVSARKAADAARHEADRLWRRDRRGRQLVREIDERLRELRQRRKDAAARDQEVRELHARRQSLVSTIADLQGKLQALQGKLRRANRLAPVRRTLQRIAELEARAGDLSLFGTLPDNPLAERDELDAAIARDEHALTTILKAAQEHRRKIAAYSPADRRLIEREAQIQGSIVELSRLEQARDRQRQLSAQIDGLLTKAAEQSSRLLACDWHPDLVEKFLRVQESELRARIYRYRKADQRYREARARTEAVRGAAPPAEGSLSYRWGTLIVTFGLSLVIIGGSGFIDLLLWGGIVLVLLGCLQLWARRRERIQAERARARYREAERQALALEQEAADERDAALQQIEGTLSSLPIAPVRLENPDETLLIDIQEVQRHLRAAELLRRELDALHREVAERLGRLRELWMDLRAEPHDKGLVDPFALGEVAAASGDDEGAIDRSRDDDKNQGDGGGSPGGGNEGAGFSLEAAIRALPAQLAAAHERRRTAAASRDALRQLEQRRMELESRLEQARHRRNQLIDALRQLGGPDEETNARLLQERRAAMHQAVALREHLQRQYPDWERLIAEVQWAEADPDGWTLDDESIVKLEGAIEEVAAKLERCREEAVRLEEQIEHLQSQTTLDEIDGAIAALEAERAEYLRERDRLVILSHLLLEADQRFREEHQPDVLRRAGEYLHLISGGRYVRLYLEETPEGRRTWLKSSYEPFPIDVDARLSRGTLDQIYLALRLAVVDHLDAGQEPLPLFLDEVLVNWDAVRRENGWRVLERLSAQRQIFLFTCHDWLAREVVARIGAQRIDLPGPAASHALL